ncbi:MAG: hypothetical protein Q8N87_01505 [bacterium]|nr:hypothetical protein [bacterium]
MKILVLKNRAEEVEGLVIATMVSLEHLLKSNPIVFYELVMKCRDNNYQFLGNTAEPLEELGLVQRDRTVHDSIRNIVLSAAEGSGLGMKLVSPVPSTPGPLTAS